MGRPLVAIDWGTSALRGARLDDDGAVLEERAFPRGILTVEAGKFAAVFDELFGDWMSAPDALCLIAGMAGSKQGWIEAPYCACPAGAQEVAAKLAWVAPDRIAIVPGLSCAHDDIPDVMRGEETQVFGALSLLATRDATLVLPGTHSKWVTARDGRIETFSTFMTGEVFALLRKHSILARTMPSDAGADTFDEAAFADGVHHAIRTGNLLAAAFSVRTLALFNRLETSAASSFLSGLVIGEELRAQRLDASHESIVIIANETLLLRYEFALELLGARTRSVGAEATWRGLAAIARHLENSQ